LSFLLPSSACFDESARLPGPERSKCLHLHTPPSDQCFAASYPTTCQPSLMILAQALTSKSSGDCGTILIELRSLDNPMVDVSNPSMKMLPPEASITRKRDKSSCKLSQYIGHQVYKGRTHTDDFPEPVRPTIPTFSPGFTEKLISLRTVSSSGR
jgi:hypothetical protein